MLKINAFICLILFLSLFEPNLCETTKRNESLTKETTVTSVITESQFTGNEIFLSTELTIQSTAENLNPSDNVSDVSEMTTDVSNISETTNVLENRKKIINDLPDKDGSGPIVPTSLPVSGSLKPLIIAIILFLGFLLFIACLLIYWFCISID